MVSNEFTIFKQLNIEFTDEIPLALAIRNSRSFGITGICISDFIHKTTQNLHRLLRGRCSVPHNLSF